MSSEIRAKATAGAYAEVIQQIYDSLDKRIREAVSNAFDASAKKVKISVFCGRENKIIIYDNGHGMDENDLKDKYINLGGGDNYCNEDSIGRIGIGALSVFGLGDTVSIRTRKKDGEKILIAALSFADIKNDTKHAVPLEKVTLGDIKGYKKASKEDAEHFTEITITNLSKPVLEIFNSEEKTRQLVEKLRKILPVPYMKDDPVFDKLSGDIKDKILQEKYLIDVNLRIPHLGYDEKIYRKSVFKVEDTRIREIIPIFPFNIEEGQRSQLTIYGYLYINAGKQLPKIWQGINARVKNVTIEDNSYLGYEEDAPARVRIGGELFISNIDENHAIQSNRSGFAKENYDYILIAEYMRSGPIKNAIDKVRRNTKIDSAVKKIIRNLERLNKMLKKVSDIENEKEGAENFKLIDDENVGIQEARKYSLENHLKLELAKMDVDFEFNWSGTLEALYYIDPEEDDYYTIYVHSDLKEFIFDVAGNSIEYLLSYCGEEKPIVIKKVSKIYLNLDNKLIPNKDIASVEIDFLKAVLITYLNYLRSNSVNELYNNTITDLAQ